MSFDFSVMKIARLAIPPYFERKLVRVERERASELRPWREP